MTRDVDDDGQGRDDEPPVAAIVNVETDDDDETTFKSKFEQETERISEIPNYDLSKIAAGLEVMKFLSSLTDENGVGGQSLDEIDAIRRQRRITILEILRYFQRTYADDGGC